MDTNPAKRRKAGLMETIGRSGRHRLHWLSLNGDSPVGPQNAPRNCFIGVYSCPFVVFYCMVTAKVLPSATCKTPLLPSCCLSGKSCHHRLMAYLRPAS